MKEAQVVIEKWQGELQHEKGRTVRSAIGRLPPRPVALGEQIHLHSLWL